jgi:ligand-binding sensor protein
LPETNNILSFCHFGSAFQYDFANKSDKILLQTKTKWESSEMKGETMNNGFRLEEIVDIPKLQEIQDRFCEVTGLAAVTVDYTGAPITAYSNFSPFCAAMREREECFRCFHSDAHGGLEAARIHKPYIYYCHTGLVDFAAPILFEGQFIGALLAGQVRVKGDQPSWLKDQGMRSEEWKSEPELVQLQSQCKSISVRKIKAAAELMFVITNYIVEQSVLTLSQEKLNEKNVKLIEEMEARMELEKALKDAELKALENQVNPHFLFNVLSSINSLALIEDAPKTSEMVYALSEMLRYTLKRNMKQTVMLKEELDYTEKYLKIQNIRLNDGIKVKWEVDDALMDTRVPFMSIQPLVSNAVNHGIFPKEEGGMIRIRAIDFTNRVEVSVTDDGIGMTKSRLKEIQQMKKKKGQTIESIGIWNTYKRLQHLFGPDADLMVKSMQDKGTTIVLKIPKNKELSDVEDFDR